MRLARLISYLCRTCDFRQYCHEGNTAEQCRLGLFQDSDLAGDLEVPKSGGILCVVGCHTFVPIRSMRKKQTSVSQSTLEAEVTSLDACLRMDGISYLDFWDLLIAVLQSSTGPASESPMRDIHNNQPNGRTEPKRHNNELNFQHMDFVPPNVNLSRQKNLVKSCEDRHQLKFEHIDFVLPNVKLSRQNTSLYFF